MVDRLGARLAISVDVATARFVRSISHESNLSMSAVLAQALDAYLAEPIPDRVHLVHARVMAAKELGRGSEGRRPSPGGTTVPYVAPEDRPEPSAGDAPSRHSRGLVQRISFTLSPELRSGLEQRADAESLGYSDIVRAALDAYLFDVVRRGSWDRSDEPRGAEVGPTEVTATL